jgi:hypothetical protein
MGCFNLPSLYCKKNASQSHGLRVLLQISLVFTGLSCKVAAFIFQDRHD